MLRINLLPSYVPQRRLTKRLVPVFALLLLVCIAAPLAYYAKVQSDLKTLTAQADEAEAGKGKTDALKAQASTTLAQVGPIQSKLQFVEDVHAYTRKVIALWNTLAETSPKASFIYTGAQVTGTTMAIKAYSPSVEEVGRYLQVMYHEPDFQTVAVDKVPGYPDNIRHFYYLDGVLVFADGATGSGGGGAFASGSPSGFRGGPPAGFAGGRGGFGGGGFGGGQASANGSANISPDAIGPNAPANLPPGVGPPPAELLTGGAVNRGTASRGFPGALGGFPGAPGGFPGSAQTGSGGYSPKFLQVALRDFGPFAPADVRDRALRNALRRVVTKTVAKGFDVNVTATLKQPLTPPSLPGAAPAATGPGGFPGGFPGGPPAGYPGGRPPGGATSAG